MFFWFIATSVVAVGFVFRDPSFDYRLLIVGSVLPGLDRALGGYRVLHSITVSVVLLAAIVLFTARGSRARRTLLGLPIGMFLHLVFDAAWNDTDTFWWPLTGLTVSDGQPPVVDRGLVSLVLEAIGIAGCVWLWRLNDLGDVGRRHRFLSDGQLVAVPERFR